MKTIYNVKALCVVALLGSAAAASAQAVSYTHLTLPTKLEV